MRLTDIYTEIQIQKCRNKKIKTDRHTKRKTDRKKNRLTYIQTYRRTDI